MATVADLQTKVDGLANALAGVQDLVASETSQVAADFQRLRDQLAEAQAAGGVTPEQLDAIAASIDAASAKVTDLGSAVQSIDADQPAPPVTPPEPPVPTP